MADIKQGFEPVSNKVNFPDLEEVVLQRWGLDDTFHRVEEVRRGAPLFVFYEGPPTANGNPGIHHVLSRAYKDVILRYKTMRGFRPLRRGGWDTHGLPVELEVEKELGLNSKADIERFGIEEFNRRCRESVFRYVKEWEAVTERSGVWLDMKDAYITYDNSYVETGWWVLKQLWERGLVYEGYKVTPHCPRCVTSLSSHEVAQGYEENTPDPSVYVRFPLSAGQDSTDGTSNETLATLGYDRDAQLWTSERPSLMVWTTTPWTLTANTAVAIAPQETYVLAKSPDHESQERVIVAQGLLLQALGADWQVLATFPGEDLAGLAYEPPYRSTQLPEGYTHRTYAADYVTTDDGTGLVHTAPAFGAEDQELGRMHGLPTVHTVNRHGLVEDGFPGAGKFVKEADADLIADLDKRGLLFRSETIRHTYPFCWRCGTPLLYYAKTSWYIRTTAEKDLMVMGNAGINWYPEHIQEGRFGEWLRNNVDWAISRERYWGTPLPLWRCQTCAHVHCIGGVDELREMSTPESRAGVDGLDLHRPYIDRIDVTCPQCGGVMRRVPEVADAWYDSGAMPFAQWAYPVTLSGSGSEPPVTLRNVHDLLQSAYFPADYITEGIDQTRGWFYSLLALSTLIAGKPSYKNVISLGLILDEAGEKMSKSKGNIVDPWTVLQAQGADALRWYLFTSAPAGGNRRFSARLVQETLRRFLLTLWNTFSFFVTYANLDGFRPQEHAAHWKGALGGPSLASAPANELDRWIISELNDLIAVVTTEMDAYNPTEAGRRIEEFVDLLSNWYVRRSRRRFWKSENDEDKTWGYVTLYSCLLTVSKLMAPLAPFVADEVYNTLAPDDPLGSLHLTDFPVADPSLIDERLDKAVRLAMRVASLGRAARSKAGIKVRQPLTKVLVQARPDEQQLLPLIEAQVLDELNVKFVEAAAGGSLASYSLLPNLPLLGPKYGKQIGAIRAALKAANASTVAEQVRDGQPVTLDGFTLEPGEVLINVEEIPGLAVAIENGGGLVVAVDATLTPELAEEGIARELVHRVQNMRKDAGLNIEDRIVTYVSGTDEHIRRVIEHHRDYIGRETLSVSLELEGPAQGAFIQEEILEGVQLTVGVVRATAG
jgi:isoleucyl-tRNA synthetase